MPSNPTIPTAARVRPYTSPHPIARLQAQAIEMRDAHFAARRAKISELVIEARKKSDTIHDEFHWTLVYDLELAPEVTGRQRILEQGIIPVPPQELTTDMDLHDELWTVIEALANCGIYFINTNHMCDRDFYCRLYFRILEEPTKLMPPASEACEYIDCMHPLDLEHPLAKRALSRDNTFPPNQGPYRRSPIFDKLGLINDRDYYLPRPSHA